MGEKILECRLGNGSECADTADAQETDVIWITVLYDVIILTIYNHINTIGPFCK